MSTSNVRLRGKEKLELFSDMSTMLTAGIPILEVIEALKADTKGTMRKIMHELGKSLTNGEPLSQGMEHFPRTFDPVILNVIRAAETGGTLEETLQDTVKTLKKDVAITAS